MSMLDSITVRCGLCGTETEFDEILSTSSAGSSDLDTRSPAIRWAIIQTLVQRCPGCGYCASDVRIATPDALAVIKSQEYLDQLSDPIYPELVNSFLCKAILDRESKTFSNATWALIHAAWFCDDAGYVKQAQVCRYKAADMLMLAEELNQKIAKQDGMSVAILVDLLRRSEQVDQARKVVEARRSRITDDLIKRILDYQSELLDKNDFSRHTVAEARPRLKQNHIEAHDANEHQVTAENRNDQFDSGLDEDTDDEAIWEEYQREKGNESSLTNYADHEAIWEDYRQAILDEQRRNEEDESDFYGYTDPKTAWAAYQEDKEKEKFRAYVNRVMDSHRKNGFEAPVESHELQVHPDRSGDEASNTQHTNPTNRSIRSMIGHWVSLSERHFWSIVMIAIASIAIYMWFDSVQKDKQLAEIKKQERAAFETARISTNNSLLNLAGCMANHASEISLMRVGQTIYKIDTRETIPQEDAETFNETRNALYERCANSYLQKIKDELGTLTERELNTAFIQVMREEPGVVNWIDTSRAIHEATTQVLIK